MVVILSSYTAIVLGVLLLVVGTLARRRANEYSRYLLGGGAILVGLGLLGILWFMLAFS